MTPEEERLQQLAELARIRNEAMRRAKVLHDLTEPTPEEKARHRRAHHVTTTWLRTVSLDPGTTTRWQDMRARIANLDPRFGGRR